MITLSELNLEIDNLENGPINYNTCDKLATLYIIRDKLSKSVQTNDVVVKEYNDILPSYQLYVDTKTKYQLGKANKNEIISMYTSLVIEIVQLLQTLLSNSDLSEERTILNKEIGNFLKDF